MVGLHWICLATLPFMFVLISVTATPLSVSEIQATGKVLFRALRDSECKVKCKSRKSRVMCGSDGVSYLSKCEVKRARRCEGKHIVIKKKGKCSAKDVVMTKCFQEKEKALKSKDISGAKEVFVPECKSDGTFASVQCHQAVGYCWCVSKDGKPISRTSTNNGRPNCDPRAQQVQANPPKGNVPPKRDRSSRKRKKCSRSERTKFNSNIVRVFTEEYNRSAKTFPAIRTTTLDPLVHTLDKQVIEWKFTQYDANKDNFLQKKEVKILRRLVKKFIRPRSCAKRFLKYCDSNRDKLVSRTEWSLCLGVDQNKEHTTKRPALDEANHPTGDIIELNNILIKKPPRPDKSGSIERPPSLPGFDGPWNVESIFRPRLPSKPRQEPNDCLTERAGALEQEADNPDAGIFIPNCTDDGKWTEAQCHKSTGYCWCADANTGRPITGTSTHGVPPKCTFEDGERQIPGCTYAEKQSFIAELLNTLTKEMNEYSANNYTEHRSVIAHPKQSIHERAVRWKFSLLDADKNDELSSSEHQPLKQTIQASQRKMTRKCARKFIRYCDEDGNKKLALQEWVDCMGISRNGNINMPVNHKRVGTNPFDKYLRDT